MVSDVMGAEHSMFSIRGDLDGTKDNLDFANVKQFIGLLIGKEEFLLPIEVTNEIIMMNQLTFVPLAPLCIEGVINLRGTILTAISLRPAQRGTDSAEAHRRHTL